MRTTGEDHFTQKENAIAAGEAAWQEEQHEKGYYCHKDTKNSLSSTDFTLHLHLVFFLKLFLIQRPLLNILHWRKKTRKHIQLPMQSNSFQSGQRYMLCSKSHTSNYYTLILMRRFVWNRALLFLHLLEVTAHTKKSKHKNGPTKVHMLCFPSSPLAEYKCLTWKLRVWHYWQNQTSFLNAKNF